MVYCSDCGCGMLKIIAEADDTMNLVVRCLRCKRLIEVEPDDFSDDIGV